MTETPNSNWSVASVRKTVAERIDRMRGTSIKAKSARGVAVLTLGTGVERGLRLVRNMILARILVSDDFGLMAKINVVAMALEAIMEVGVKQSVIQNKRGADDDYLNAAWWMQAVRGLCLYGIAFLIAPQISSFYNNPRLVSLLRVSFLSVMFRGFVSPGAFVLEKEYKFGRTTLLVQGSAILGTTISVIIALISPNVWSLVIGLVAEAFLLCMLSYIVAPYWPSFRIERGCLSELLGFARGMFGLAILTVVARETDILVLGRVVTEKQLGIYYLARSLVQMPLMLFGKVVGPVMLPAFSEMQDNKRVIRRNTLKILRVTFVFGIPVIVLAAIFAKPILSLVYGSEYAAVSLPFAIMCFVILLQIQAVSLAAVFLAIGKPYLIRRFNILLAFLIVVMIYPGVKILGLTGAAGVLLLSNIVALFMQVLWLKDTIGLNFKDYLFCWRRKGIS